MPVNQQELITREFPDFDQSTLPVIPDGFECTAWHNDTMPTWYEDDMQDKASCMMIAIDFVDPDLREFPEEPCRFHLYMLPANDCSPHPVYSTNEWSEVESLVRLVRYVRAFGLGFHPDTRGSDYVNGDGARTFTDDEAGLYDATITAVCGLSSLDIYEFSISIWNALGLC